tara:strand:- start:168 stop:722 length:555 start_codon:yes stop_codon:yes gene_type:complete
VKDKSNKWPKSNSKTPPEQWKFEQFTVTAFSQPPQFDMTGVEEGESAATRLPAWVFHDDARVFGGDDGGNRLPLYFAADTLAMFEVFDRRAMLPLWTGVKHVTYAEAMDSKRELCDQQAMLLLILYGVMEVIQVLMWMAGIITGKLQSLAKEVLFVVVLFVVPPIAHYYLISEYLKNRGAAKPE